MDVGDVYLAASEKHEMVVLAVDRSQVMNFSIRDKIEFHCLKKS